MTPTDSASSSVPIVLQPAFWAVVSIAVSFALTWLLLHRPRKWWVLLVALAATFVLFGPFGLGGFLLAIGLKLWQNKDTPMATVQKSETAQTHARRKRRQKPA